MRLLPFVFILIISGCGGGKVEFHKDSTKTAVEKPQWIDAELALSKVLTAQTPEDQEKVVLDIQQRHAPDFSWNWFWENLTAEISALSNSSPKFMNALFELSFFSREEKDFRSFANFVIAVEKGFEFLTSSKRKNSFTLGPTITTLILRKLIGKLEKEINPEKAVATAVTISQILVEQYRSASASNWDEAFATLNQNQWDLVAKTLMNSKKDGVLLDLVGIHYQHHQAVSFVPSLVNSIIRENALLKKTMDDFGLEFVGRLLLHYPSSRLGVLPQGALEKRLNYLTEEFLARKPKASAESFRRMWTDFLLLRGIQENWDSRLPLLFVLEWLEKVHRKLEDVFTQDFDLAADLLDAQVDYSLDKDWVQFRLSRKSPIVSEVFFNNQTIRVTRIDRILGARLAAHLEKDVVLRNKRLSEFCQVLSQEGIVNRKIKAVEFLSNPLVQLKPGCLSIEAAPAVLAMNVPEWVMPFDMAILVTNSNFNFKVTRFDGSLFSLNTTTELAPMQAQAPLSSREDAIAFPLVVGFKIAQPDLYPDGVGVYYFVIHLSRSAQTGRKSPNGPLPGVSGGNLKIEIKNSMNSFPPTLVSLGGPGQKAAPAQKGGKGNHSGVNWFKLQEWFNRLDGNGDLEKKGERPIFEVPHFTIRGLRDLQQHASQIDNEPDLFINADYVSLLEAEDQAEIREACTGFNDLKTCFKKYLGPLAAKRIKQILEENTSSESEDFKHPFLSPESFDEPNGKDGVVSPDGSIGKEGLVEWIDLEKEGGVHVEAGE